MDARLQRRVQRYGWDAAAPFYQDGWSAQLRPAHDTLFEFADLRPGMRVLETACGTGLITFRAARAVAPGGLILATDLSGEMTAAAARYAEAQGIGNVETARMGAEELEVEDGSFDLVLCALGLMYVPDVQKALSEMGRAVRPGGRVVATVWGERRNCGWAEIFPIVDAHVASEVCPMFFGTGAPGALQAGMEAAGLSGLRETRQLEVLEFENAESLLDAVIKGGPVAMAVKRFSEEIYGQVESDFLATVSDFRKDDGSYAIPGEFVTISGTA
jgi:SAM-dependent methyltransferase